MSTAAPDLSDTASPPHMTLGVEEELLVVDRDSGALQPRAQEVLAHVPEDLRSHVGGEMNACQLETNTTVCEGVEEVEEAVARLRREVARAAGAVGTAVVPAATHPSSSYRDQSLRTSVDRYAEMGEAYRLLADQQIICGLHVHVGMPDRGTAVTVMRRLRPWLPVLLALSANSPGWEGLDSGYASFRTEVWRRWPTAGFPPPLPDARAYDEVVAELIAAEAVPDASRLYWHLRPSTRYQTLEVRGCDVPLRAADSATLAGLYRGLAWVAARGDMDGDRDWSRHLLDAAMWRAARYGVDEDLLHPRTRRPVPAATVVDAALEVASPGLAHHGDVDRVTRGVRAILDAGTGADVQRRLLAQQQDPVKVVDALRHEGGTA